MFEAVEEKQKRRTGPAGMLVSLLFHGALAGIVILAYAFTKDVIEAEPEAQVVTFFSAPPPPPPPPPPASSAKKKQKKTKIDTPKVQPTELVQPKEIEEEEEEEEEFDEEFDGGVEGGVLGGVKGGEIGGVIGGTIGGVVGGTGSGPVNLGYSEKGLFFLEKKQPDYPKMAQRTKVQGTVIVEIIFGLDGKVETAKVVAGPKIFHDSVLSTIRTWRIEPYVSGGVKAKVKFRSRINFRLTAG